MVSKYQSVIDVIEDYLELNYDINLWLDKISEKNCTFRLFGDSELRIRYLMIGLDIPYSIIHSKRGVLWSFSLSRSVELMDKLGERCNYGKMEC